MNRNLLTSAICASLLMAGSAYAQTTPANTQDQNTGTQSQQNTNTNKKKKPETLQAVTVTGSLIPQSQVETANPVITITAQDIQRQGFNSVYQALRAQPLATGSVQTNVFSGGFTPSAQTVSLLGLAPKFTLYLLNGRPMADFPLLYNGQANFTSISNIPISMIDRIEILPGNQSAIYGSSAIAGVINIILKQHMSGYDLNFRAGGYTEGGGQQERFAFSGGNTLFDDKLNIMYSVQAQNVQPIWGFQRKLTASSLSSPNPADHTPFPVARIIQVNPDNSESLLDPNQFGGCGALSGDFNGSTARLPVPDRGPGGVGNGYECGSYTANGYRTLLNKQRNASGYFHGTFQLNDNTQFFASILYSWNKQRFFAGPSYQWWAPDGGNFVINQQTGLLTLYERIFGPKEYGGLLGAATRTEEDMYNATFGVQGTFGNSNWNYEGYVTRSDDRVAQRSLSRLAAPMEQFFKDQFLGPQLGTYYGYGIYNPGSNANISKMFQPITPQDFQNFSSYTLGSNHTYEQRLNFQVTNTDLFDLPGGPVGFAGLIEGGSQVWDNIVDPRITAGDFFGLTGTSGQGTRDAQGAAVEFDVPVFKSNTFGSMSVDVAGRYDHYSNVGLNTSDQDKTYKLGIEYRPIPTLLLRGNIGTAFKAPNMAGTFEGPSGSFTSVIDYYKCEKYDPTLSLANCPFNDEQIETFSGGTPALQSVTAKSYGFGAVWSPTQQFTLKADYYHINIQNEVEEQSLTQLLQNEARCRLSNSSLGTLDPNSPTCINTLAQITRSPVNANPNFSQNLQNIQVKKINVAEEFVKGIVAELDYKWDWGRYGHFGVALNYNVTLDHRFQQFPFDPVERLLHDPQHSSEFKNIATATLDWDIGKWDTTIEEIRYGATPNYAAQVYGFGGTGFKQSGTMPPWIKFNGSVSYHVTPDITASLISQNIFNATPPLDRTWVGWPYFNQFNYDPYGRVVWLQLNVHFPAHG